MNGKQDRHEKKICLMRKVKLKGWAGVRGGGKIHSASSVRSVISFIHQSGSVQATNRVWKQTLGVSGYALLAPRARLAAL